MIDFVGGIISTIFGSNSLVATLIVSMLPIIELKGAIPIGMSVDFWGKYALSSNTAFLISLIGSSAVVPIIALIFMPILDWLKRTKLFKNLARAIEEKVQKHSADVNKKSKNNNPIMKCLLLFLFVAVPLPLTGVWTGTCVGVAVGLKFWQVVIPVILGNIIAGLIIKFVCGVFPEIVTILALVFLGIVVIMGTIFMIKLFLKKSKKLNGSEDV